MIDQINQLIAINLQLFFNAVNKQLSLKDFRDLQGKPISGAKILADIMQQKELIRVNSSETLTYELTEFGLSICLHGGWETHLEKLNKISHKLPKTEKTKTIPDRKKLEKPILIAAAVLTLLAMVIICSL